MKSVSEIPLSYLFFSIFFSGFIFFALVRKFYLFAKLRRTDILVLILFYVAAMVYVGSDALAMLFSIKTLSYDTSKAFVLLRELAALLFVVGVPALLASMLILRQPLRALNRFLFLFALVSSAVIAAASITNPQLLIGAAPPAATGFFRASVVIVQITPLLAAKNIIFIVYLVYAVCMCLYSSTHNLVTYSVNKIIAAFCILLYFVPSGFFYIFMFNNQRGYVSYYYPHIGAGAALFILLISFELVDNFYSKDRELDTIRKRLISNLYIDTRLNIPNRAGFTEELRHWFDVNDLTVGSGNLFSLVFIDIDNFTHVNESFGERVGDSILAQFSARLKENFSKEGELYRIGGDDFVLWLGSSCTEARTVTIASRIISSLRNPFVINGVSYLITASIGILQIPRDGDDVEAIFANAYSAIRSAKKTRNNYKIFNREMVNSISNTIQVVNLLRSCISSDQFVLYFQPVMDSGGRIVYAESLLRCTNPDPTIGGPGKFIPVIEKAGLMKEVDDMVIRKAFYEMENSIKDICDISVNLSSNQLVNPAYCNFIGAFAHQHRIAPDQVILEVVEDVLIDNLAIGRENLLRLKEKGFKIALDDFGKGFSSLSYLSELPVDIIKIDMAFVRSVPGNKKNEAIAAHIVNLGHALGLKVVAEGFEKREQIDFFLALGCDNFQGFYYSKPLPIHEFLQKYKA